MRTIQFNKNITFEQYEMAVLGLEAIGLEVKKEELSAEVIEGIEQGWKELHEGKGIPSEEVHKKSETIMYRKVIWSPRAQEKYISTFGILDRT